MPIFNDHRNYAVIYNSIDLSLNLRIDCVCVCALSIFIVVLRAYLPLPATKYNWMAGAASSVGILTHFVHVIVVCKGMGVVELMHAGELCALIVTQRTLCTLWPTQSHCSGFVKCRIVSIDYARQWDHTRIPSKMVNWWRRRYSIAQPLLPYTLIFIANMDHTLAKWLGTAVYI